MTFHVLTLHVLPDPDQVASQPRPPLLMLTKLADALKLRTNPTIFFLSAALVLAFVVVTVAATSTMDRVFSVASAWVISNLGWLYILGVTSFLAFLIFLLAGRFGRVRLGRDDESPQYSDAAWFSMLFAAGIGTILMFWAVAEPVNHYANPPFPGVEPQSEQAAGDAMAITLYHFGLHTWTIFTLPGLAFAYFMYQRNLPPRVSSLFQPLLGDGIHGRAGRAIDILAIVGTIFGVGVSIGLGTMQINSGLARTLGIAENDLNRILIIAAVTLVASVSAALGVDKGIKRLSNMNILIAVGLLVFVLISGPTITMLKGTIESMGTYLDRLPWLAFWNDTFAASGWQDGWTVFYWAWTITWSPFVGIFIARISRGRTIRQFIAGVLALPTAFTIIWFGIFGMGVFEIEKEQPGALVDTVVGEGDIPGAMFEFLAHFPFASVTSAIGILLVAFFFITSMDSAGLIMDHMASGHDDPTPAPQRIFWVVSIGAIAATLLTATGKEGLTALQNVAVLMGLPFFLLGYLMMYSIYRGVREDAGEIGVLPTRIWRRVLPPEEYQRRAAEGSISGEVVAPDYVPGSEPESAPALERGAQPEYVEDIVDEVETAPADAPEAAPAESPTEPRETTPPTSG